MQPTPPAHVPGRFHLFGIDWLLDGEGKLHLLEGNGYPLVTHYDGIDLTPKIWYVFFFGVSASYLDVRPKFRVRVKLTMV